MTTQYRGPWNYAPDDVTQRYIYNDDGGVVCKVDAGNPRADSDGALIAAAPDLLDALQTLLHYVETPGDFAGDEVTGVYEDVVRAINKATGR